MQRAVLLVAALLAACGNATGGGANASPVISGDTCVLHQDAESCRADLQGCAWYPNTRACYVGQPCPAGWCYHPQPLDGGSGFDGGISAACACSGAPGDACVMQIGGPAVQVEPPITCEAIPASCALPDRCACLAQGTLERCWSSDQVANLCVCDNGVR